MAKVLILGGGFGGVVAAEGLAHQLGERHQITLVSRTRDFIFYPALVRLAFGKCHVADVSFDLRQAMLDRRVNFVEAEVAYLDPFAKKVTIAHGDVEGQLAYDFLVFAMGRRLATERITGFFEHAHHVLNIDKTLVFGKALAEFHGGSAVIGQCDGARLPVPIYETAFALARRLEESGERDRVSITVVTPDGADSGFGDFACSALAKALEAHGITLRRDFPIRTVTKDSVATRLGDMLKFDLLMLLPPFQGPSAALYVGAIDSAGYLIVDRQMRLVGHEGIYAVGDCVNFDGPKMGYMAVRQGTVAAANLAAEIEGHEPVAQYSHELRTVIDESRGGGIYVHKDIWGDEPGSIRQGRFWSWAKRVQQRYWEHLHA